MGQGEVVAGKWTQLYLNNNKNICKRKLKKLSFELVRGKLYSNILITENIQ